MKQYLRMILFVVILGAITSFSLVGMNALTKDRIEANKQAELQITILRAHDISYTMATLTETFESNIEQITYGEYRFYVSEEKGYISFRFEGSGVWGPIIGIVTFESDFRTIVNVTILQQEETPGLGGVVAETRYLANYVGVILDQTRPYIEVTKQPITKDNQVQAITAATRTSERFELLLNNAYEAYKNAWASLNE